MFPKVWASLTILLAASLEVHAHAAVAPVLGLGSTAPKRANVKRPNNLAPCGLGVNVAQSLAKSTPVQAAADGTFTVTATNFNAGRDGSRQFTAQVDPAASGKDFSAMTISQNGQAAPASTGSEDIVASLPAGTTCTGGSTQNLCLVSFKSLGGFGNCVAVQQGAGGAAGSNATTSTATGDATTNSTSTDSAAAADSTSTNSTATDTSGAAGASGSSNNTNVGAGGATGTGKGKGKGKGKQANNGGAAGNSGASTASGNSGAAGNSGALTGNGNSGAAGNSGASAANGNSGASTANGNSGASTANGNSGASAGTGSAGSQGNKNFNKGSLAQGGSRAARALLADLKECGEGITNTVKRSIVSWVWA